MDVSQKDRPNVGDSNAIPPQLGPKRLQGRSWSWINYSGAETAVQHACRDHFRLTLEVQVDVTNIPRQLIHDS